MSNEHLPDEEIYKRFKKSGYRKFKKKPIKEISMLVDLAYLDVNRTLRGIKKFPNQAEAFKKIGKEFLINLKERPPKSQNEFNKKHTQACIRCREIHDGIKIYYGQAQKLINMSLKYFYNEYAIDKQNHLEYPAQKIEYFFHIPIDNIIINYLKLHHKFKVPNKPWSQWPKVDYENFQEQLRKKLINNYKPLEIDYLIWDLHNTCVTNNAIN